MRRFSRHHVNREAGQLALLVALAVALYAAAGIGMAYVGGFAATRARMGDATWPWFPAVVGSMVVAYLGYWVAYRGVEQVEGGPELDERALGAVVTAGFGGFLAHGGAALDDYAMKAGGASDREASVRVTALGGLEHGVLAVGASAAAIALLVAGLSRPPGDFTYPWAIVPALGFGIAFWAAERYRGRLRDRRGLAGKASVFLDGVHLIRELFRRPRATDWAVLGMALFWAGDFFALWAALAAFGFRMNAGALIVAAATGMIVTRRTGPLGGAGLLIVALVPSLWYSGAPWTAAVLGVATYRFVSLFGPLPFSFAVLPQLRALGERAGETPGEGTEESGGEPALRH